MADVVNLWGTIGTWMAVLLGLLALIGIISPWLVLRAALSERNQALSSVQDHRQDYVTKGIGFGRRIRLRRKAKVPDLKPDYDVTSAASPISIFQSNDPWISNGRRGTTCRIGWAKFCRLLESYKIRATTIAHTRPPPARTGWAKFSWLLERRARHTAASRSVAADSGGELIIHQGQTWLPVSRYWILIVGLLGRYGNHRDSAHVHGPTCRADIDPYQVRPFDSDEISEVSGYTSDDGYSITSSMAQGRHRSTRASNSSDDTSIEHISQHHMHSNHIIHGLTGSFRKLKGGEYQAQRNKITSPLYFEVFSPIPTKDALALSDMLWLACGFTARVSGTVESGTRQTFCLQDPPDFDPATRARDGESETRRWLYHMQTVATIPRFLQQMTRYLAIPTFHISAWRNFDIIESGTKQISASDWISAPSYSHMYVKRADLERIVMSMLKTEWREHGYLIWKSNNRIWHSFLKETTTLLEYLPFLNSIFKLRLRNVEQWKDWNRFEPGKSKFLIGIFSKLENRGYNDPFDVRIAVATMFITDNDFRTEILALIDTQQQSIVKVAASFNHESGKMEYMRDNELKAFKIHTDSVKELFGGGEEKNGVTKLKSKHLLTMALWAATRCALWRGSPSSRPLLRFVKSMDSVAHVM